MTRLIIGALAVGLALTGALAFVSAQTGGTTTIEVRVWQSRSDAERLYISARPTGGSWDGLGTNPLNTSGVSASGVYRYGDISLAGVDVRVWQRIGDANALYISARPEGGSWHDLGTLPLEMDGESASGRYRFGDIALAVEAAGPVEPPVVTPTPTATPTPGPTYGSCSAAWADGLDGHWTEEEARALGLPLERSDSDGDGIYCERRTRATATPTPTPSPTPVPTARPTPTPVPSYSQPPPSGGSAAPRSTPTAAPTPTPTHTQSAAERAAAAAERAAEAAERSAAADEAREAREAAEAEAQAAAERAQAERERIEAAKAQRRANAESACRAAHPNAFACVRGTGCNNPPILYRWEVEHFAAQYAACMRARGY